jgi:hypothetical protein
MGKHPGPTSPIDKASIDRAREGGQRMFRSMLLVFTVGFAAFAVVAFIATGEIGVVFLVVFTYLGIAVCGWFGQRWLLRNMDGG